MVAMLRSSSAALATTPVAGLGQLPSGGGPGTLKGLAQSLVSFFDYAFNNASQKSVSFNRDVGKCQREGSK